MTAPAAACSRNARGTATARFATDGVPDDGHVLPDPHRHAVGEQQGGVDVAEVGVLGLHHADAAANREPTGIHSTSPTAGRRLTAAHPVAASPWRGPGTERPPDLGTSRAPARFARQRPASPAAGPFDG